MAGQLIFQPPTFHWPSEDQQTAFKEWQCHITLMLEVSNIPQERWYASIVGFLGTEGFKWWQHLNISKQDEQKKHPENMFKAFADTLEVSMSYWNYIDEMYSDIRRWTRNHWSARSTHQDFSWEAWLHVTRWEDATPTGATLSCNQTLRSQKVGKITGSSKWNSHLQQVITACQATWGNCQRLPMTHKSNSGVAMSTTINKIRTFNPRKGQGQRARSKGKICGKCGTSHPPRECPAWGKKCHKCGNKNHFSTQCRSKQSGAGNRKSHSTSRGHKGKGKPQESRSRSTQQPKVHTAWSQPPFKTTQMTSMEKTQMTSMEKVQTSMDSIEETSMEPPFKTIQIVLNSSNSHSLPFPGWSLWLA